MSQGTTGAADAARGPDDQPKAKIFISYSRKDMAFADRLDSALKARGFEPLIDREEIYAFEDWWKRLQALMIRADTVVFVISPDAVASHEALKEVEYAASLNKRFAPIVCRRAEDSATPEALRRLNFIFFDDPARFEASADQLAEALQTDIGWIRQHTEFGEAVQHWSAAGRPGGLLLRSPVLEQAERWIASRPRGAPEPTAETRAYVAESRRGMTRRRNILTGSLAAGLVVALALAGLAYWQRGIAVEQRNVAEDRRLGALIRLAAVERLRGAMDAALRLAVHGGRLVMEQGRPATLRAASAELSRGIAQTRWSTVLSGHRAAVLSASFSPDGSRIATSSSDATVRLWDAATGAEVGVLLGHTDIVTSVSFDNDGSRLVTASRDNTARIWDVRNVKELLVLRAHGSWVNSAEFSRDGTRIVTASLDATARVWDAETGTSIATATGHRISINFAAFNPDGTRIVTASDDWTAAVWDSLSGKQIAVLRHKATVNHAMFNSDGSRIVTASSDGTAKVWDAETGNQITVLQSYDQYDPLYAVEFATFNPDGSRVVTTSMDRTARIWDAATGKDRCYGWA